MTAATEQVSRMVKELHGRIVLPLLIEPQGVLPHAISFGATPYCRIRQARDPQNLSNLQGRSDEHGFETCKSMLSGARYL